MPEVVERPARRARGGCGRRPRGFLASIVNGEVVLRDGEHTGAFPGRLLRGPLARR